MTFETTLIYNERVLRDAVFAFWRRTVGSGFLVALLAIGLALGVLLACGDTSWWVGALASGLAVGLAFIGALYVVHYRSAFRKFRAMGHSPASFSADASSFTFRSTLGTTTLGWAAVEELWKFETVWLLLFSRSQFSTLPVGCLPPEMQAFIVERIRCAGGRVGV